MEQAQTHYRLDGGVVCERDEDSDDAILIDGSSGRVCTCNETATFVLDALRQPITHADLTDAMCKTFAVDATVAHRDIGNFLATLADMKVLKRSRGNPLEKLKKSA